MKQKINEARQKLPLKRLMDGRGRGAQNGHWANFKCPYCGGNASVFPAEQGDRFKCFSTSCKSQTSGERSAWDEIGFLAFELGLSRKEAMKIWFKEAGVSETERHSNPDGTTRAEIKQSANSTESGNGSDCKGEEEVSQKNPLQAFYERLTLIDADRMELREKRGLSDQMIEASGFRSNVRSNLEILQSLTSEYTERQLVACGLWTMHGTTAKPSAQFYGFGTVGKKKRLSPEQLESGDYDELEDDDFAWDWKENGQCNPLLIPYYDLKGELIALRPHKGFPKGQKPRLYLAGGKQAVRSARRAVAVEGEFTAAALQDVLGSGWAVAAVPGITQVKNFHVWGDILAWAKNIGATEIIVSFDTDIKSDPSLPSYEPRLEDRLDATIWARVCAIRLDREGYSARVAHLPEEWADKNKKTDWDSALAKLRHEGKTNEEIKGAFESILNQALRVFEFAKAKVFSANEEQIISDRAEALAYEPALPFGGKGEKRLAKDLRKLAQGPLKEWANRILQLADAYERTWGWYYELKISENSRDRILSDLQNAEGFDQIKFLRLALKGTPSLVAPFQVIPHFVLIKSDGSRDRMVELINIRRERSGLVPLDENSMTAPRDFRRWLARIGNYGWEKGEGPLQALTRDNNFKLARLVVKQLVCYGCMRPGELWVLDDCALAPDGTFILPDKHGVFWYNGLGYMFLRDADKFPIGEEGQSFRMKSFPRMRPGWGLIFDQTGKLELKEGVRDDPQALKELMGSFITALNDSYGGHDGTMLAFSTLGYMAGPEIFSLRNEFPGIFISGEKGSGKTFTSKCLMGLHGFTELESAISLATSTGPGGEIPLGQYANIPLWGDEYKRNWLRDERTNQIIHSGFNREMPSKWSQDGKSRTVRTNFLITGETTCESAATMSRFVSAVAARERRKGTGKEQLDRLQWLQDHRKLFFAIGRAILQQRAKFAARVVEHLAAWERLPELADCEPRARFCYGVSYASFLASNEIIPVFTEKDIDRFRNWLIEKTTASAQEIAERVTVNQFWRIFLNALPNGVFGRTPEELRAVFKLSPKKNGKPGLSERQLKDAAENPRLAWKSYLFYFVPGPVIDAMQRYLRSQGKDMPLDQTDLLAQMQYRPYFVPGPRQGHQKKFARGARRNTCCWCIDFDLFEEFGLRLVSDEIWNSSFYKDGDSENERNPLHEWIDPRKGELFAIEDALREKEQDERL